MEPRGAIEARISQIEKEAESLHRKVENFTNTGTSSTSSGGSVIIRLDAGKFSTWAAAVTCLLVLAFFGGAVVTAGLWFSREFSRIDSRFNDQTDTDSVQDAYIQKLRAERQQERK